MKEATFFHWFSANLENLQNKQMTNRPYRDNMRGQRSRTLVSFRKNECGSRSDIKIAGKWWPTLVNGCNWPVNGCWSLQLWVSLKTRHPQGLKAAAALRRIHGCTQRLAGQTGQAGPKARLQLLIAAEEGIWHQLLKNHGQKIGRKKRNITYIYIYIYIYIYMCLYIYIYVCFKNRPRYYMMTMILYLVQNGRRAARSRS